MTSLPVPSVEMTVGRQGHYAGGISRLLAFGADIGAAWGLFSAGVALFSLASELVTGKSVTITHHQIVAVVLLVLWAFVYFSYPWAVSGKSIGMAIFGLRVVTVEGAPISARQAVLRTLSLPLSILVLGLGFVGIFYQRERRAMHDLMVGTAVVYAWDARAARLRWMARREMVQPK
jgi:uncharacterized RDD family membrane protein YckC